MELVHDVVAQALGFESENVIVGVYEVVPKARPEIVMERPPLDAALGFARYVIPVFQTGWRERSGVFFHKQNAAHSVPTRSET